MIWYDARNRHPVAPGEGEDGGPPSIDFYYCYNCKVARHMKWSHKLMLCAVCSTTLLIQK